MLTPKNELRGRLEAFEDTQEICDALLDIADQDGTSPYHIYWLKETVCSLQGLYDLARSAVFHATKE